jgi:hypothetical protein
MFGIVVAAASVIALVDAMGAQGAVVKAGLWIGGNGGTAAASVESSQIGNGNTAHWGGGVFMDGTGSLPAQTAADARTGSTRRSQHRRDVRRRVFDLHGLLTLDRGAVTGNTPDDIIQF